MKPNLFQILLAFYLVLFPAADSKALSLETEYFQLQTQGEARPYIPPAQESFTFDADGNRESSALWNYRWDGRNRLIEARTKDWDTAPRGYHLTFDYDSEGRRFKKDVIEYKNGKVEKETQTTFVYDGWDLLYELRTNAKGTVELERKYVWGNDISGSHGGAGGAGGLLLIRETKGTITTDYYPLFDGSGHLTALTKSNGTLVAEYAYGPFGELIHAKGPMANANPWRYATKYYDQETGLYYFGHRYYDPVSGQWLNREPLGEDESLNLYVMTGNDPINHIDVRGLRKKNVVSPDSSNRFQKLPNGQWQVRMVQLDNGWGGAFEPTGKSWWENVTPGMFHPTGRLAAYNNYAGLTEGGGTTTAGAKMWGEAATIAVEKYRILDHAKAAPLVMGGLIALPVTGSYIAGGGLTTLATGAYVKTAEVSTAAALKLGGAGLTLQQGYQRVAPFLTRVSYSPTLHNIASDGAFNPGLKPGSMGGWIASGHVINPFARTASQLRNSKGVVSVGVNLPDITGRWLRGTHGNAGNVPGQIARQFDGQKFKSFDQFREAFWRAIAEDSNLASQFNAANLSRMQKGLAPIAAKSQQYGGIRPYILHHITPIHAGGGVFDLGNIRIVTPRFHQEILIPSFHFGR